MENWETISFVNASKVRFVVLIELKEKAKTPSQLSNILEYPISRISQILKELLEKKLIECLTPNKRKSKYYGITSSGKEILQQIHELTSTEITTRG